MYDINETAQCTIDVMNLTSNSAGRSVVIGICRHMLYIMQSHATCTHDARQHYTRCISKQELNAFSR